MVLSSDHHDQAHALKTDRYVSPEAGMDNRPHQPGNMSVQWDYTSLNTRCQVPCRFLPSPACTHRFPRQ